MWYTVRCVLPNELNKSRFSKKAFFIFKNHELDNGPYPVSYPSLKIENSITSHPCVIIRTLIYIYYLSSFNFFLSSFLKQTGIVLSRFKKQLENEASLRKNKNTFLYLFPELFQLFFFTLDGNGFVLGVQGAIYKRKNKICENNKS